MAVVAVGAPWPLTPGARPGGPGRWPPVSGPSGACSGCVRTAAGAPPHRGGARGESFDVLLLDPTSAALTTPRASHPVRTLHQTAPGDRRTSSFVCGIEKYHVGDRDRLFGSSFSTSTGHRKRNPRAALRNARALPSGASLSARETASDEGAGRSQITESGQHYPTTTAHRNLETTAVAIRNL